MKALKSDEDAGYINNIAILFSFFIVFMSLYMTQYNSTYMTQKKILYIKYVSLYMILYNVLIMTRYKFYKCHYI